MSRMAFRSRPRPAFGDGERRPVEGGRDDVGQGVQRYFGERALLHGEGQALPQFFRAGLPVDPVHLGMAEHRRPVAEQQAHPARHRHGLEVGLRSVHQRLERGTRIGAFALDLLRDRARLALDNGAEQVRLVGEVMIERAARDLGRRDDLRRAGLRIALLDEQLAGDRDQRRPRGFGALLVGAPDRFLLHTYSLYVN